MTNPNITVKILRFYPAFLPFLPPFPHSAHISYAKKTALPAGQKNHMDYLFLSSPQPPVGLPDTAGLDRDVNHRGLDL